MAWAFRGPGLRGWVDKVYLEDLLRGRVDGLGFLGTYIEGVG